MKVDYLITNGEKIFLSGSRNTLITDQDIDTRQFYRADAIHATSNFNFHDSINNRESYLHNS